MARWYTGTPRNFRGDETYFARESGLTCRGLQKLGHDSRAVMPGPPMPDDLPDLIRATKEELASPVWWEGLGLEGMIFYTWGSPRYARMVSAARSAGVRVAQVTDTQGVFSPLSDWKAHLGAERAHYWHEPRWKQTARTLAKIPVSHTVRILTRDIPTARAIAGSEFFLVSTPQAEARYRSFVSRLVGTDAARKVRFIPVPVNFHFRFDPAADRKEDEVLAVGRWDSLQKRTPLLLETISLAIDRCTASFRIFGKIPPEMEAWYASLNARAKSRVILEGVVPNAVVAEAYKRAKVMLVSSAYEGCHNSSAEAVCSGASVVGCRSPFLSVLEWHCSKGSGRLADKPSARALADALCQELECWDTGGRDPGRISMDWMPDFRPDLVAKKILDLFSTGS